MGGFENGPSRLDQMEQPGTGHFTQHRTGVERKPCGQLGSALAIEGAPRVEIVGAVQDPPHHVPFGQTKRVIAYGIEHAAIPLAFGPCPRGTGRPVPKLGRARIIGGPAIQL